MAGSIYFDHRTWVVTAKLFMRKPFKYTCVLKNANEILFTVFIQALFPAIVSYTIVYCECIVFKT